MGKGTKVRRLGPTPFLPLLLLVILFVPFPYLCAFLHYLNTWNRLRTGESLRKFKIKFYFLIGHSCNSHYEPKSIELQDSCVKKSIIPEFLPGDQLLEKSLRTISGLEINYNNHCKSISNES